MAVRISEADFDSKVLDADEPVIVEFYSDSCVACKKLSPVLGDAEDKYSGRVLIYKVNSGFDAELAERYEVKANPTLLAFKDGEVKRRSVGAISEQELDKLIEAVL